MLWDSINSIISIQRVFLNQETLKSKPTAHYLCYNFGSISSNSLKSVTGLGPALTDNAAL